MLQRIQRQGEVGVGPALYRHKAALRRDARNGGGSIHPHYHVLQLRFEGFSDISEHKSGLESQAADSVAVRPDGGRQPHLWRCDSDWAVQAPAQEQAASQLVAPARVPAARRGV